jgi:hypothetical protein
MKSEELFDGALQFFQALPLSALIVNYIIK